MVGIAKKTQRYPTDLTDEEWLLIEPLMPGKADTGRKRAVDFREIVNALRFLVRSGCGWRLLPKDFPPRRTVYWWFRQFVRRLLFQTIHDVALMPDRERAGRRKRHIAVDTEGRSLMVNPTPADVSDSVGAQRIFEGIRKRWPWMKHLFADGGYDRTKLMDKAAYLDFTVEIVRRGDAEPYPSAETFNYPQIDRLAKSRLSALNCM